MRDLTYLFEARIPSTNISYQTVQDLTKEFNDDNWAGSATINSLDECLYIRVTFGCTAEESFEMYESFMQQIQRIYVGPFRSELYKLTLKLQGSC